MKKILVITIAAGAAALAYFVIRKKYSNRNQQPQLTPTPRPEYEKHHLTNVFSKAKQHAMQASQPS